MASQTHIPTCDDPSPEGLPPPSLDTTSKSVQPDNWAFWGDRQQILVDAYREEAHEVFADSSRRSKMLVRAAERAEKCGLRGDYIWHDCGHDHQPELRVHRCEVPGCQAPGCARAQSAKRARKLETAIRETLPPEKRWRGRTLKFITLTTPTGANAGQEVTPAVFDANRRMVWKAWDRVCRWLKRQFRHDWGVYAKMEYGAFGMCHIHALFWGPFLNLSQLTAIWESATGGKSVKISKVEGRYNRKGKWLDPIAAVSRELCKYITKPARSKADMGVVASASIAVRGTRTLRGRGCFYNVHVPTPPPPTCPVCGCSVFVSSETYTLLEGILSEEDDRSAIRQFLNHREFRREHPLEGT